MFYNNFPDLIENEDLNLGSFYPTYVDLGSAFVYNNTEGSKYKNDYKSFISHTYGSKYPGYGTPELDLTDVYSTSSDIELSTAHANLDISKEISGSANICLDDSYIIDQSDNSHSSDNTSSPHILMDYTMDHSAVDNTNYFIFHSHNIQNNNLEVVKNGPGEVIEGLLMDDGYIGSNHRNSIQMNSFLPETSVSGPSIVLPMKDDPMISVVNAMEISHTYENYSDDSMKEDVELSLEDSSPHQHASLPFVDSQPQCESIELDQSPAVADTKIDHQNKIGET